MNSQYPKAATVVPNSASNLVRGEDHGCYTAADETGADVWCYGNTLLVGNGSLDTGLNQLLPARVSWDPHVFEAFAFAAPAK